MALNASRNILNSFKNRLIYPSSVFPLNSKLCSTVATKPEVDIEKLFINKETQRILYKITGFDLKKLSKPIKKSYKAVTVKIHFRENFLFEKDEMKSAEYKFVLKEEYERLLEDFKKRATEQQLQLYPVMKERKPIEKTLATEPDFDGYTSSNWLFIDTSKNNSERKRSIWVRQTNGDLKTASWEQRDRMNRIFFPVEDREVDTPRMFEEHYFDRVLKYRFYTFGLHRLCLQFEPDDPIFIKLTKRVYDHIETNRDFHFLRSTRFFGTMAFYFATEKSIDKLLKYIIDKELILDAKDLVKLYSMAHPSSKLSELNPDEMEAVDYINAFINLEAQSKPELELSISTYSELQEQKKEVEKGIKSAHGVE